MKRLFTALLASLFVLPATAQEADLKTPGALANPTLHAHADGTVHGDAFCGTRFGPEDAARLEAFRAARDAGLLVRAAKNASPPEIDSVRTFNILVGDNINDNNWSAREFILKDREDPGQDGRPGFLVWVRTTEWDNGNVTQDELDNLRRGLLESTPSGSIDPNQGIMDNLFNVYGGPPNFDGDNYVDLVLYDIEGQSSTIGFVHSADLGGSQGNNADVLYLDSNEGTSNLSMLEWVAAHEYTHLIHFGRLASLSLSSTYILEMAAEYAMVLNGYLIRTTGYLNRVSEYNSELFNWTGDESDYQRAGLFTTYIASQIGPSNTGDIVRTGVGSIKDLRTLLTGKGTSLQTIIGDFHVANKLNKVSVDPRFGYSLSGRRNVSAAATTSFDGTSASNTPETQTSVKSGGTQYLVWDDVANFSLNLDVVAAPQLVNVVRARLRVRAILEQDGTFEVRDLNTQADAQAIEGSYDRITVVVAHVEAEQSEVPYRFAATWGTSTPGFTVEEVVYDDGNIVSNGGSVEAFFLDDPESSQEAVAQFGNRFTVPAGAILDAASVAVFYDHDFNGSSQPADAPRDFTLKVWDVGENGEPGDTLFTVVIDDDTGTTAPALTFKEVDLGAYASRLSNLPDEIFITVSNAGTDRNFILMGVSAYTGPPVSYLFIRFSNGTGWARFDNITSGGNAILAERVVPLRATFKVPTGPISTEDEGVLPERVTLAQNYPNPFNPTTTIRYTLPQAMPVRLAVYDLLGRQVAVLAEGLQPVGTHEVRFDAANRANGLYFYTLEAEGLRQTRTMMLIK